MTEAPSEAFDRREFVVLTGESRDGRKQKFLPIIRSGNGKFFGFGESENPGLDEMQGRFAQLLPPKVPDEQMRELAKAMLKIKGVGRAMPSALRPLLRRIRQTKQKFTVDFPFQPSPPWQQFFIKIKKAAFVFALSARHLRQPAAAGVRAP